ncbi:MAG: lysophospholipid acyltransferase family protein, partial [Bacteroidota bacterium]
SDFLFYVNFYFIKYRRKVVELNLVNSFPEKSKAELLNIEKKFFRILTDYIVESLKSFTISKKAILTKGKIIENPEMTALLKEKRNIIISVGHVGNQELVNLFMSASPDFAFTLKAAYHQLANPYFDQFFHQSRTRFGSQMYTMKGAHLAIHKQDLDRPFAFFLVNDQSSPPNKSYWTNFLNQETSFYKGMAVFAKKYDMPVFFMHLVRPKRGQFELSFVKITDEPTKATENEILEKHVRLLENNILEDPQIWLWSHKRWKHKKPE